MEDSTSGRQKGNSTETKTNPFVHSNFNGQPNPKVLADFVQINSVIKRKKKSFIIDARSKDEDHGSAIRASACRSHSYCNQH